MYAHTAYDSRPSTMHSYASSSYSSSDSTATLVAPPQPSTSLHVYRGEGSMLSNDRIIKAADKSTSVLVRQFIDLFRRWHFGCSYYLNYETNVVGWTATLYEENPSRKAKFRVTQAALGSSSHFHVLVSRVADGWTTSLHPKNQMVRSQHAFTGLDGKEYRWRSSQALPLRNNLQVCCI